MKKRFLAIVFVLVILLTVAFPVFASEEEKDIVDDFGVLYEDELDESVLTIGAIDSEAIVDESESRLYDGADILSTTEETKLLGKLDEISQKYNVDVVVATIDTVGQYTADEYVEYFYDNNNYGVGDNRDGVILLISMLERDYRILSNGFCAEAITMDTIKSIGNKIAPSLSEGDYAEAFDEFADECDYYINGKLNGFPFKYGRNSLIAIAAGLISSFIGTNAMKGKLKSVKKQTEAADYTKKGSLQITKSNDFFLYRSVNREAKAQDDSSSRSSGSPRNVGGGKF